MDEESVVAIIQEALVPINTQIAHMKAILAGMPQGVQTRVHSGRCSKRRGMEPTQADESSPSYKRQKV